MKKHYNIADFNVTMNCQTKDMLKLCECYKEKAKALSGEKNVTKNIISTAHCKESEIDLCYTEEERKKIQSNGESLGWFEYLYTGSMYIQKILEKDAFCFHASALSIDGEALLFSADSGTGKSTHARLWEQYMQGEHELVCVNDDKPVIRMLEGEFWVYGTPWAGKHSIHMNAKAEVKGVVFLRQAKENSIREVPKKEAFHLIFAQTFFQKSDPMQRIQMLELLDKFIRKIPIYELSCNISEEAVRLVYDTIWREKENED